MASGKDFGTANYPAFASKAALLQALDELNRTKPSRDWLLEIQIRLSNTDTSVWGDPTATQS